MQGVGPVLAAEPHAGDRVVRVGDVAGGVDVRQIRAECGVGQHSANRERHRRSSRDRCSEPRRRRPARDRLRSTSPSSRRTAPTRPCSPAIESTTTEVGGRLHATHGGRRTSCRARRRARSRAESGRARARSRRCRGSAPSRRPPCRSTPSRPARVVAATGELAMQRLGIVERAEVAHARRGRRRGCPVAGGRNRSRGERRRSRSKCRSRERPVGRNRRGA